MFKVSLAKKKIVSLGDQSNYDVEAKVASPAEELHAPGNIDETPKDNDMLHLVQDYVIDGNIDASSPHVDESVGMEQEKILIWTMTELMKKVSSKFYSIQVVEETALMPQVP